jgi:large subunit ribosomal protein L13
MSKITNKNKTALIYTINAQGMRIGRVASEAATALRGKDRPDFKANIVPSVLVHIINVDKIAIHERKLKGKLYTRYTGYPGGLRKETAEEVIQKKGYEEVLKRAVYGMLPANKLRKEMLKNLKISN